MTASGHRPGRDAATGHPIWADRFDRDLTEIFALQDEIAEAVVAALKIGLIPSEREAITSRPTDNPAAFEIYMQARYHHTRLDRKNYAIASRLAQQALEIDPIYDRAWALLAISQTGLYGLSASAEHGLQVAERALSLNPDLAEALAAKARVLAENSSDTYALICGIGALARLGEVERAKQWAVRVKAVDPDDPSITTT